jgi:hypothetical protein
MMTQGSTLTAARDGVAPRRDWDAEDLVRRVRFATQPAAVAGAGGRLADLCYRGGALGSIALIADPSQG